MVKRPADEDEPPFPYKEPYSEKQAIRCEEYTCRDPCTGEDVEHCGMCGIMYCSLYCKNVDRGIHSESRECKDMQAQYRDIQIWKKARRDSYGK